MALNCHVRAFLRTCWKPNLLDAGIDKLRSDTAVNQVNVCFLIVFQIKGNKLEGQHFVFVQPFEDYGSLSESHGPADQIYDQDTIQNGASIHPGVSPSQSPI